MRNVFVVQSDHLILDNRLPVETFLDSLVSVSEPDQAEAILVLGGDGTMLSAIRQYRHHNRPFIGLNYGHVGFLLNQTETGVSQEIISDKIAWITIGLLEAELFGNRDNHLGTECAFNDMYFERSGIQTAHLRVEVNNTLRRDRLIADGIIIATPAGSTAYNASAHGPVVPIDSRAICLTGISPAIFQNWRSSVLSAQAVVEIEALDTAYRPVRFLADGILIPEVTKARITTSNETVRLGFVRSQDYQEKVLSFQFG